ncbi:response regulator transcription factor [Caulobacter sp. DWR1-3-2b1]|uniref:response regulator transcription factor n=1 Tax=Caulobacter sp. DWR1-3-2b1 TaxID=2804670 RepID=UPI003CF16725
MTGNSTDAPRADLTPREVDVLRMIGRGLTVTETGRALEISGLTVSGHVKAIYRKLDICSRAEAATEAARRGLT